MNETIKTLLISLSCLAADFSGIAVVAKCLISKWSKMKEDLHSTKKELIQCNKKLNDLTEALQWQVQSNEELKLELRGIKSHGEANKKN